MTYLLTESLTLSKTPVTTVYGVAITAPTYQLIFQILMLSDEYIHF